VVTTNHVVAETITLVRARGHRDPGASHRLAVEVGQKLFAGAFGRIHQATAEEERAAFAYLVRYGDKVYNFVDCLSFVIMEKLGIEVAWSVDDDFNHRFRAVPGPLLR
jgi:predicted nucleic acid-binding protein